MRHRNESLSIPKAHREVSDRAAVAELEFNLFNNLLNLTFTNDDHIKTTNVVVLIHYTCEGNDLFRCTTSQLNIRIKNFRSSFTLQNCIKHVNDLYSMTRTQMNKASESELGIHVFGVECKVDSKISNSNNQLIFGSIDDKYNNP